MEYEYDKGIRFEKELNTLDRFTIRFTQVLERLGIRYVLVSGYVAILFGRNRASEDVDMFIERLEKDRFQELWNALDEFECVNATSADDAYDEYLAKDTSLRFSLPGTFIPNMEVKFPKIPDEEQALATRMSVTVNGTRMYIAPLEGQIAYKLYLGSDKDIEDAIYLYTLFQEHLDASVIERHARKLQVLDKLRYLDGS